MSQKKAGRWVPLQYGERFVGDLWPGFDERQRREILVTVLCTGKVPMRARFAAKPRDEVGQAMLPRLERDGLLGTSTPLPNIEAVLLHADPHAVTTWDIPAARISLLFGDDKRRWGPFDLERFFPGGATIATGRSLVFELDNIEFDCAAARAYIRENLLPAEAMAEEMRAPEVPPADADSKVVAFPHGTARLQDAVRDTLAELGTPGQQVPWKQFCDRVRERCGVSKAQVRGYSDKTITRIVRTIEAGESE